MFTVTNAVKLHIINTEPVSLRKLGSPVEHAAMKFIITKTITSQPKYDFTLVVFIE